MLSPSTLTTALDMLPIGVVLLDGAGRVVFYNRYEERLAGRTRESVLGQDFFNTVAPCTAVTGLADEFHGKIGKESIELRLDFHFPRANVPVPRDVHLELVSLRVDDQPHAALIVQDVSLLRAIERTKDFAAGLLAHDMRSPITAASGYLDLLVEDLNTSPDVAGSLLELIHNTRCSIEHLRSLVSDLGELTRLQSHLIPLHEEPVDVARLLERAVSEKRPLAERRRTEVQVDPGPPGLEIRADPSLIRRAVDNLLDNALRHAGAGTRIDVVAGVSGDLVTLEVADRGPGIPEALRNTIFDAGRSLGPSSDLQFHGLGLALVKLVMDRHGGTVTLHERPGGGSVFRLTFPVAPESAT